MKVLVSAASKHGATAGIAEKLGEALEDALREQGASDVTVEVRPSGEVRSVEGYDAVVLGSAVYAGHWLKSVRELAERHADVLAKRPVWLFSSGPIGDPPSLRRSQWTWPRLWKPPGRASIRSSPAR